MPEVEVETDSGEESCVPTEHLVSADGNITKKTYGSIVYVIFGWNPSDW